MEHDLYNDSATLKKIDNGYMVIMSARNTASDRNESYEVEKFFKTFKEGWEYLEKIFDATDCYSGHMIRIKTEF